MPTQISPNNPSGLCAIDRLCHPAVESGPTAALLKPDGFLHRPPDLLCPFRLDHLAVEMPCRMAEQPGMTTASPANSGIEPITSSTATSSPHSAIGHGFCHHRARRGLDGRNGTDIAVEQQRESDHRGCQHESRRRRNRPHAEHDQRSSPCLSSAPRGQSADRVRQLVADRPV